MAAKRSHEGELRRLQNFRSRVPYVSQNALSQILQIAKSEPLPELCRRTDIRDARNSTTAQITAYGPIHETITVPAAAGAPINVEYQNPFAIFHYMCKHDPDYAELVKRTHAETPSSVHAPWTIILYSDEVSPGNQLSNRNERKSEALYWNVLQFGSAVLSDEHSWLELVVVKSNTRQRMRGGLSGLVARCLTMFFDPDSHNMATAGIHVELHGSEEPLHIWMDLGAIFGDEAALHSIFCCKGAAGFKPCLLCANVFNTKFVEELPHGAVDQTCSDYSQLQLHNERTIQMLQERLANAQELESQDAFKELEIVLGWKLVVGSLLSAHALRHRVSVTTQCFFDWMHCIFVRGVFNYHLINMLKALKKKSYDISWFEQYAMLWVWPSQVGSNIGVYALSRKKLDASFESGAFKCSASEALSLLPVLANFVFLSMLQHGDADVRNHAECFLLLASMVGMFLGTARRFTTVNGLRAAIDKYLAAYKALYAHDHDMQPKFHFLMHFPDLLQRFKYLPACFVLERKHRIIKKYANMVLNVRQNYSASVLREVTANRVSNMPTQTTGKYAVDACLIDPSKPTKELQQVGFIIHIIYTRVMHVHMRCMHIYAYIALQRRC